MTQAQTGERGRGEAYPYNNRARFPTFYPARSHDGYILGPFGPGVFCSGKADEMTSCLAGDLESGHRVFRPSSRCTYLDHVRRQVTHGVLICHARV